MAIQLGSCFTSNGSFNYVKLLDTAFLDTDLAYGISTLTISGSDYNFSNARYRLNGVYDSTDLVTGFTCSDGVISHITESMVISITGSGLFISDNGPGYDGFVGMEAPAADIVYVDLLASGREFRGIKFQDGSSAGGGEDTEPVWARPGDDPDKIIAGGYEDPFEDGVEVSEGVIVTLGTQSAPGIINSGLQDHDGDPSRDIVLMVNQIGGRYIIYGAHRTADLSSGGGNFILIEQ